MVKKHFLFPLFFLTWICGVTGQNSAGIQVLFSETYELANVILALTPYGIADEWEVQKSTPYYEEVMRHFKFMEHHPLLEKANYSREKWEDYLSFRTDAFAFEVNGNGKIQRQFEFWANTGHRPFDENLPLIQDFYEKSNFHDFYQSHQAYFDRVKSGYKAYFMMEEMQQFLTEEFGTFQAKDTSLIVCSPLVYRTNCRRNIKANVFANFATLDLPFLVPNNKGEINPALQISDIHLLFIEMDQSYVNVISDQYAKLIAQNFKYKKWSKHSGYKGKDCFNEYMIWAVYDLFSLKYFPQYADQINRDWHLLNNNRGFIASSLFSKKLLAIYAQRGANQHVKDLYPQILDWTQSIQGDLKVPNLKKDSIRISLRKIKEPITIPFSETLQKMPRLDVVLSKVINGKLERIKVLELIEGENMQIKDKSLIVNLPELPEIAGLYGISMNVKGQKHELVSENGVPAPCPTRFFIRIKQ